MKKIVFILSMMITLAHAQTKKPVPKATVSPTATTKSMSATDSLSYAIGVQVASYYKAQGVEKINNVYLDKAFNDVFNNQSLTITEENANMKIQQKLQEFMTKKISVAKEAGTKFLEENKKRPGVITLPRGLQYEIITKGTGPIPKATDTVKAHYTGTLLDGTEFDNSYKRGEALTIPVSSVIKGWVEALQLMPVGSKWKLFVPSDLAYGDRGAGGAIPGGSALIFEIELLSIVNQ
jgi:FKBP-type peptidyl-prolyl cis-trans isomerase